MQPQAREDAWDHICCHGPSHLSTAEEDEENHHGGPAELGDAVGGLIFEGGKGEPESILNFKKVFKTI